MNPPANAPTEADRQMQVRTGQAINLAWQYATLKGSGSLQETITAADNTVIEILEWINTVQARQAFPGSTVVPSAPTAPASPAPAAQAPQMPQQQVASGPPAIPNRSRGGGGDWKARKAEENWRQFLADTSQWEDLRPVKQSGAMSAGGPDYRHKTEMDGKYKKGVWISEAPQWAHDQLRQWGVIA